MSDWEKQIEEIKRKRREEIEQRRGHCKYATELRTRCIARRNAPEERKFALRTTSPLTADWLRRR